MSVIRRMKPIQDGFSRCLLCNSVTNMDTWSMRPNGHRCCAKCWNESIRVVARTSKEWQTILAELKKRDPLKLSSKKKKKGKKGGHKAQYNSHMKEFYEFIDVNRRILIKRVKELYFS